VSAPAAATGVSPAPDLWSDDEDSGPVRPAGFQASGTPLGVPPPPPPPARVARPARTPTPPPPKAAPPRQAPAKAASAPEAARPARVPGRPSVSYSQGTRTRLGALPVGPKQARGPIAWVLPLTLLVAGSGIGAYLGLVIGTWVLGGVAFTIGTVAAIFCGILMRG
jgi:hypothetical protein